jgi:hypothetical protein
MSGEKNPIANRQQNIAPYIAHRFGDVGLTSRDLARVPATVFPAQLVADIAAKQNPRHHDTSHGAGVTALRAVRPEKLQGQATVLHILRGILPTVTRGLRIIISTD